MEDIREKMIFWLMISGLAAVAVLGSCNGNVDPCELSHAACLATCETECVSVDGCFYTCKEEPPPPPPPPVDPCEGITCECGDCVEGVCPECPPPPPPPEFLPPTAAELEAAGIFVEVKVQREGRNRVGYTPRARFGKDYYCRPEVAWPEACAAGRSFGPVAPDGHPKRAQWEAHFLGQPCATFTYDSSEHMSFDPFFVIDGVNQNHPRNVEVCGQAQFGTDPSWKKDSEGYIKEGQWSTATAHGNGQVCAEGKDGVGRTCMNFVEQ